MSDPLDDFINTIRPNGGHLHVVAIDEDRKLHGKVFPLPKHMDDLRGFITANNVAGSNIYYTLNEVEGRDEPSDLVKPSKDQITGIVGFHADVDPDLEAAGGDYTKARESLLNGRCEAIEATHPTVLVDSGNGLQALYIADTKPDCVDDAEAQNYALLERLGGDPGTHNIDRLLRMPSTINYSDKRKQRKGYPAQTEANVLDTNEPGQAKLPPPVTPPSSERRDDTHPTIKPLTEAQRDAAEARWREAMQSHPKLAKRWEGNKKGLNDKTRSGIDKAIGSIMNRQGFSLDEFAYLVKEHSPANSAFAEKDARYLRRCWERDDLNEPPVKGLSDHPLLKFREWPDKPRANTFIIPGVLTDKVSYFAAYAGKGKTSAWVSMCAVVTGAMKVEGLEPEAPRHVVYASEHPEQVELMLQALVQRGVADESILRERFHVVETQRMEPAEVVKAAPGLNKLAESVTRNGIAVEWEPYVVIDTTSATFNLEDENKASLWADVIAKLKHEFEGIPVTMIGHTSKDHRRGDNVSEMTVIGSSRQDSDVTQLIFLTSNPNDPDERFIEINAPKKRFEGRLDAIQLKAHRDEIRLVNQWEQEVTESVLTVDLIPVTKDQRAQALADAKRQKYEQEMLVTREVVATWMRENQEARDAGEAVDIPYPSQNKIVEAISGKGHTEKHLRTAVQQLIENGRFERVPVPEGVQLPGNMSTYLRYKDE